MVLWIVCLHCLVVALVLGVVGGLVWLFENSIVCQVCLMPFIFEWLP